MCPQRVAGMERRATVAWRQGGGDVQGQPGSRYRLALELEHELLHRCIAELEPESDWTGGDDLALTIGPIPGERVQLPCLVGEQVNRSLLVETGPEVIECYELGEWLAGQNGHLCRAGGIVFHRDGGITVIAYADADLQGLGIRVPIAILHRLGEGYSQRQVIAVGCAGDGCQGGCEQDEHGGEQQHSRARACACAPPPHGRRRARACT